MKSYKIAALVLVPIVVLAIATGVVLTFYYPDLFSSVGTSGVPCPSSPVASLEQVPFTIIISNRGLNNSGTSAPCPTINVAKGQSVTIHVVNNDRETHGFAITTYLDKGMELRPGESRDITFTANQAGSFRIYCNIGCAAHHYQQGGRLNVTG